MFTKGESGNPSGRPQGAKDKIRIELKTWLGELIDNNRVQLEQDLKKMNPRDRWHIVERLMQYTTPKLQNVEATLEYDKLTDEHLNMIVTDLLNNIENDTTN